ncbi:MAG TPA: PQQ-binding-like beta-propeller repeat protein [Pyrinomonadaceae bacterium]
MLKTLRLLVLAALALPAFVHAQPETSAARKPAEGASQIAAPLKLRWPARPRARRYRLQVALDEKFNDIVFDRAVEGLEQEVSGLQPGKYYWRVAPATPETGRYSAPALVEAALPVPVAPTFTVLRPPTDVGWQAAIGTVARPFAARLRGGKNFDLVALNSDGTVYALDAADGTPLWVARSRATAPAADAKDKPRTSHFTPLVLPATAESRSIVAAGFGEGIRGLDGETGRELWRSVLQGRPAGGALAALGGSGEGATSDFVVATSDPDTLYVLEGCTGRIVSKTKLGAPLIGSPIPFSHGEINGIAYSLENRQLEIRKRDGSLVRSVKFDVPFSTPPLVLATPRGTLVIIGTDHGLLFFEGSELKPLGRITTEKDAPRGRLTAADLNEDGTIEVVMVTKNGRVAVISTVGKINWASEGATDAYMATFAHLNTDGVLDVVVASGSSFALGFSGRDGTLIWRADENAKPESVASEERMLRTLTGAISSTGVPLLVGGDATRSAVRAVGLPSIANKAAVK